MIRISSDQSTYKIEDRSRHNLSVAEIGINKKMVTEGSFFVIAGNNSVGLLDNSIKIENTCWVSSGHQTVDITGPALIIENIGYCISEKKLASFTSNSTGQLSYIDGCSNTNLIDPLRNGDPCVNYLFFPPDTEQTFHTHPSFRVLYILEGRGYAEVDNGNGIEKYNLSSGSKFILPRHVTHRFLTTDYYMSLAVYHPDSEDGPRDENNPMKSRTYIR